MRDFYFSGKVRLTYASPHPSRIVIRAASLAVAKAKLKKYIEIGVQLGWYEDNRGA